MWQTGAVVHEDVQAKVVAGVGRCLIAKRTTNDNLIWIRIHGGMPMARFAHVVVVVPGILGTVLAKDGKKVWDLNAITIPGAVLNGSEQALTLSEPRPHEEDLGDGVVAKMGKPRGGSRTVEVASWRSGWRRDSSMPQSSHSWCRWRRCSC
jgi:hypothetical protein